MLKKIISGCLLVSLVMASSTARGEAIALQKSQPSPFSGLLLTPVDAANIMAEKRAVPERIAIEVKKAQDDAEAVCKLKLSQQDTASREAAAVQSAQVKQLLDSNSSLYKQVQDAQSATKWMPLYISGGVTGGVLVGVLTTILVTKLKD